MHFYENSCKRFLSLFLKKMLMLLCSFCFSIRVKRSDRYSFKNVLCLQKTIRKCLHVEVYNTDENAFLDVQILQCIVLCVYLQKGEDGRRKLCMWNTWPSLTTRIWRGNLNSTTVTDIVWPLNLESGNLPIELIGIDAGY